MPRIELIPENWETSQEKKQGNGTPTIDVCKNCAHGFPEGVIINRCIVGETQVSHPPYDGEDYSCSVCYNPLTGEDD